MTTEAVSTRGRICQWYDSDGNTVMLTLDTWDQRRELVTTMVAHVGPFDDVEEVRRDMLHALTAQLELW